MFNTCIHILFCPRGEILETFTDFWVRLGDFMKTGTVLCSSSDVWYITVNVYIEREWTWEINNTYTQSFVMMFSYSLAIKTLVQFLDMKTKKVA